MKTDDLLILGAAALAVFVILSRGTGKAAATSRDAYAGPTEILDNGRRYSNGWRYFSDGTAIDPSGNYYQNGVMIWQAPGAGA